MFLVRFVFLPKTFTTAVSGYEAEWACCSRLLKSYPEDKTKPNTTGRYRWERWLWENDEGLYILAKMNYPISLAVTFDMTAGSVNKRFE